MNELLKTDILREVMNIGIGEAANSLSKLIKSRVKITVPDIEIIKIEDIPVFIEKEIRSSGVFITQDFSGSIEGKIILAYSRDSAMAMLRGIFGDKKPIVSLSKTESAVLEEIGNMVMVSCISSIVDVIQAKTVFSLPRVSVNIAEDYFKLMSKQMQTFEQCIIVKNKMEILNHNFESIIYILLGVKDLERIVASMSEKMKGN